VHHVTRSVTINRPRAEVYDFWRRFENLPRFMYHLQSVTPVSEVRSHWVVRAPGGGTVEWDADIIDDRRDELIVWTSLDDSEIRNGGAVRFADAPGDRGTEVRVDLHYQAPGGSAGVAIAKLLGEEPGQQLRDELRRFKQVMETGEVVLSEGSLQGAGEGVTRERPAQPAGKRGR
jgi:uncharacterized membrane protein